MGKQIPLVKDVLNEGFTFQEVLTGLRFPQNSERYQNNEALQGRDRQQIELCFGPYNNATTTTDLAHDFKWGAMAGALTVGMPMLYVKETLDNDVDPLINSYSRRELFVAATIVALPSFMFGIFFTLAHPHKNHYYERAEYLDTFVRDALAEPSPLVSNYFNRFEITNRV